MPNTEKPMPKIEKKKLAPKENNKKMQQVNAPKEKVKPETKQEIVADIKESGVPKEQAKAEEALDEKSTKEAEKKPAVKAQDKPKKTEAVVNVYNIPVSTKASAAICRFIKGKKISEAVEYLEQVVKLKKAIPMKGEIPHRKGRMMSGRFPQKAAKNFIIALRSLAGNSAEMDEPIIKLAIANMASRPYGRFGRTKKKRTHIKIVVKEKKLNKEKKNGRKKNR